MMESIATALGFMESTAMPMGQMVNMLGFNQACMVIQMLMAFT